MTQPSNDGATVPAKGKQKLDPELIYTPAEAATYLGLTTQTLAKWRCHMKGPSFIKVGRVVSYRGKDLLAFEARCLVTVGEAA